MYQRRSISNQLTFFQKIRSMDFYLLVSIILLGAISILAMYSTDISDGNFYHSFNHALRFGVFFGLMLFLSFINIKYYFSLSILFYILILLLLIGATFFGSTVSGSQRWINLYFINLQPSELMKIAIIVFLARYYHRVQPDAVNTLKKFIIPFFKIAKRFFKNFSEFVFFSAKIKDIVIKTHKLYLFFSFKKSIRSNCNQ